MNNTKDILIIGGSIALVGTVLYLNIDKLEQFMKDISDAMSGAGGLGGGTGSDNGNNSGDKTSNNSDQTKNNQSGQPIGTYTYGGTSWNVDKYGNTIQNNSNELPLFVGGANIINPITGILGDTSNAFAIPSMMSQNTQFIDLAKTNTGDQFTPAPSFTNLANSVVVGNNSNQSMKSTIINDVVSGTTGAIAGIGGGALGSLAGGVGAVAGSVAGYTAGDIYGQKLVANPKGTLITTAKVVGTVAFPPVTGIVNSVNAVNSPQAKALEKTIVGVSKNLVSNPVGETKAIASYGINKVEQVASSVGNQAVKTVGSILNFGKSLATKTTSLLTVKKVGA